MTKHPHLPELPPHFIWGASTAAYQIEGAAAEDGRGPSIWDEFTHTPGKVKDGTTGDRTADHYHRYREDVALMKRLGLDAYRFSVSWSRVLPEGVGAANEKGLDFYDRLIDEVLGQNIEPWLCLYHWDLPLALHRRGGWANRDSADWFSDYASLICRRFGDRIAAWATFNEPGVFTLWGYGEGRHAPGVSDFASVLSVAHNVNRAHGAAVKALRADADAAPVGVVCNQQPVRAAGDGSEDDAAAALVDALWNRMFADPMILGAYPDILKPFFADLAREGDLGLIRQELDFFGLNHYSPIYVRHDAARPGGIAAATPPAGAPVTMMGWEISADAFRDTLITEYERYRLPIYITENGVADRAEVGADGKVCDECRIDYLADYIGAAARAIAAGADIRGYFVWSLIDNFEWAEGFEPRFGLVHVDYETLARTPKNSYWWLAEEISKMRANGRRQAAIPAGEF